MMASQARLLYHAGKGHQLKINKTASINPASILFQTAFEGRAEIGCAGNDALSLKVSADGTQWKGAMAVEADTRLPVLPGDKRASRSSVINGQFQANQRDFAVATLAAGANGFDWTKAGTSGATLTLDAEHSLMT